MTIIGKDFPVRAHAFFLSSEKRASGAAISPADTLCFDIFSPPPADSDVINQVDRLDLLLPASEAFAAALSAGRPLSAAAAEMVAAARDGRDRVTPMRNRVGRASWLGERTEGKVDPGCEFAAVALTALPSGKT